MLTPIHIIRDGYAKVFCCLNVLLNLVVKGVIKENLFVMLMPSHSHRVTFGHIELCFGIQFYLLLSAYLSFISFLYLDLYVLGDDALISKGSFMQTKHLCCRFSAIVFYLPLHTF